MISINFVGDIALFREFEDRGIDPFKEIKLPESNYNIGNFEFIIPNKRKKRFFDVSDNYKVSYNYLNTLSLEKFDAYSFANNHCMDYGLEGVEDVDATLNQKSIKSFGFGKKGYNSLTFKIKDVSFVALAFVKQGRWSRDSENPIGPDTYNVDEILEEIKRLKHTHHHVLVYPHWGTELVDVPDPKDIINARAFIDSGASAVIGHHPHIIQGIEHYKNGVIAYSLGSFIYIPNMEYGYKSNQSANRNYSICLNISFNADSLLSANENYYRYDSKTLIPKPIERKTIEGYLDLINDKIDDSNFYKKRIREVLLKREMVAFFQRLKSSPKQTLVHYFKYIKIEHFKKIIKR